jgi:hypothetical protein
MATAAGRGTTAAGAGKQLTLKTVHNLRRYTVRYYIPTLLAAAFLVMGISDAAAQFPDPQLSQLQLQSVEKGAKPFAEDMPADQPPVYTKAYGGGTKIFGYIYEFGSFHIQGQTADAMFVLTTHGQFPRPNTVDLYQGTLNYEGKYTDPRTRITGYLYSVNLTAPANTRRFFLFGNKNVGSDPIGALRWIVYYDEDGNPTYYARARFLKL